MFNNIKVLELSSVLAGPAVGMFFAELGARVLKIENKISNGDITRNWRVTGEDPTAVSAYFSSVNYNKKYLLMDFTNPDQKKELKNLIKNSDIIITNFKDGDANKFGLAFEDCKKLNPKIIYAHIGGFFSSPKRVAFDVVLQAETGYISMTGSENNYAKMPVAMIDVLAAHQIKEGILIAMLKQKNNGLAYKVSTTLEESALASLMNQSTNYLMAGHESYPIGTLHPNIAPYGDIINTKDGEKIILAIGTDKQFQNFCETVNIDSKTKNLFKTNQERLEKRKEMMEIINKSTIKLSSKKLLYSFEENCIPYGKIKKLAEVLNSPLAKKMVLEEKIENQKTKRIKTVAFKLSN